MEERLKIINNIVEITENEFPVKIENINLEFSCNKYSSKKNSIYHIILNDKHLSKKDKLQIKYKCVTCESIHVVGTTQLLRKINKCSYRCNLCVNKDEVKRFNHSNLMLSNDYKKHENDVSQSLEDIRKESINIFDEYDDDFKNNYFMYHLTNNDYERISKNIVSLQNGKYKTKDLEFWSIFKTNNQMLFSSVFYDKNNNIIVKANQPILLCENCNTEWRAKSLEKYKNCHKIMCPSCVCCNKTFKLRTTQNCIKETIVYQSKLELKFVNWCNNNAIVVKNGPIILYNFQDKQRKYRVDFQIKDLLIEIKDNHIWYKNDIESGKNQAKIDAVNSSVKEGKYREYYLITPDKWNYTLKNIKENLNKI